MIDNAPETPQDFGGRGHGSVALLHPFVANPNEADQLAFIMLRSTKCRMPSLR